VVENDVVLRRCVPRFASHHERGVICFLISASAAARSADTSYEYRQRHPDDKEAVEGKGPIALHGLEHLVTSDKGVIMFRRILRAAIQTVKEDADLKGIIRDTVKAKLVLTTAGSVIRD
jgi:hypothetical protein